MSECARCGTRLIPGFLRCGACLYWNTGEESLSIPRLVRLGDSGIAPVERVRTGPWDETLGGGFVRTGTYLLGGAPGSGKTTLCLMSCDALCVEQSGRDPLYIAAEQTVSELRATTERLCLSSQARFLMFEAMNVKATPDLPAILSEVIRGASPIAVIVDSLPEFTGRNEELSGRLLKSLKLDAVAVKCPILILQHVTKDLDIAGLMHHQHEVDGVGLIEHDEKTDRRTFRMKKHRFGNTRTPTTYAMTETGLRFIPHEKE